MKLVYSGNLGCTYDLSTVLRAVEQNEDFELDVAGFGDFATDCSRVRFHGCLAAAELASLLRSCDVGIVPMRDESFVGVPNKMFDYAAAGLAIVSSLTGESAELLHKYACGITYRAGDAASLAEAVRQAGCLSKGASRQLCEREFDAKRIYGDYVRKVLAVLALIPMLAFGVPYEIGSEMEHSDFWSSDPVLFVKKHADAGFVFTSDQRKGADSRLDGGVTYHGLPVYESKVSFGEAGGIEHVELMLFTTGGTETFQEFSGTDGRRYRQRVRVDKTVSKVEFGEILSAVRAKLTKPGAKFPSAQKERVRDASVRQSVQTWPKTALPTQTALSWNYRQDGKNAATFQPGFVRVTVNGPARLSVIHGAARSAGGDKQAKGAKKIADNVLRDPRGDVFIDNVPMVDQGQKGYCSVSTAERVLRYYGLEIDEHELAQAANTTAEGGTSTLAMKESVKAIGGKYRLGTVVCYGDFEKTTEERIAGLNDEVRAYNKAAKKLKKPAIAESVYVHAEGNVIYYDPAAADAAMDAEVLKEMKVNGMQKSRYSRFMKDVREQVDKGIPLFWGVALGIYPEPGVQQTGGGHMRLIIGYNDKRREILYTDSWGAGHEQKRMPADWAWTISRCLMYLKPLR